MNTLLLDQTNWDLVIGSDGNIAVATDPYATAQSVANALRLFLGEAWYDTSRGVPYFEDVLGKDVPAALLRQLLADAALTVPGVSNPQVTITAFSGRRVSGTVTFNDAEGSLQSANF